MLGLLARTGRLLGMRESVRHRFRQSLGSSGARISERIGPVEILGGNKELRTCYIRDSEGMVQIDCDYISKHSDWYSRIGEIEYGNEMATIYILKADPPP